MKKILSMLMICAMIFAFGSCGSSENDYNNIDYEDLKTYTDIVGEPIAKIVENATSNSYYYLVNNDDDPTPDKYREYLLTDYGCSEGDLYVYNDMQMYDYKGKSPIGIYYAYEDDMHYCVIEIPVTEEHYSESVPAAYTKAENLLEEGKYDEAFNIFEDIEHNVRNPKNYIDAYTTKNYYYADAMIAEEGGAYGKALKIFNDNELFGYRDADEHISSIKEKVNVLNGVWCGKDEYGLKQYVYIYDGRVGYRIEGKDEVSYLYTLGVDFAIDETGEDLAILSGPYSSREVSISDYAYYIYKYDKDSIVLSKADKIGLIEGHYVRKSKKVPEKYKDNSKK